jgi:hypothetical protein
MEGEEMQKLEKVVKVLLWPRRFRTLDVLGGVRYIEDNVQQKWKRKDYELKRILASCYLFLLLFCPEIFVFLVAFIPVGLPCHVSAKHWSD